MRREKKFSKKSIDQVADDHRWYLHGKRGTVQFVYWDYTDSEVSHLYKREGIPPGYLVVDIGYHAYAPQYWGQSLMMGDCPVLDAPCYYDGSSVYAERFLRALFQEGEEAVWQMMEVYYESVFGGDKWNLILRDGLFLFLYSLRGRYLIWLARLRRWLSHSTAWQLLLHYWQEIFGHG